MTARRRLLEDDRGVSSAVTHALALGIAAILISGLLMASGTLLEDQRENSAREQLRTVGNRLAGDLSRVAALAQDGGNATIRTNHPARVAGKAYHVTLHGGSDCETDLFDAETCLELELEGRGTTVWVPVHNETDVTFEATAGGGFTVAAEANDTAESPGVPAKRMDHRVGIGSDVGNFSGGAALNLTNRPPIAGFTFTPGQPAVSSVIQFRNDTDDLDGVITSYEWEMGDGTARSGRTVQHSYPSPGKYTVTLTVTDDDGRTDNVSKVVSVGGLVYNPASLSAGDLNATISGGSLQFEVTNWHGEPVEITEVLVDPADDSIGRLDAEDTSDEVFIDGNSLDGGYGEPAEFHEGGRIFDIEDDGIDSARLPGYTSATVELNGFDTDTDPDSKTDMTGKKVHVAMHYEVNGSSYTARFTLNDGGSSNMPPDASFDVSDCGGTTCDFTYDGIGDPDGSIANYAWNFDDGTTVSGPGATTIDDHAFPANGSYAVSLTVTDDDGASSTTTRSVSVGDPPPPVIFAVNAGGGELQANGVTYEEDSASNPHEHLIGDYTTASTGHDIDGTTDDALYQSARYGEDENYWGGTSPDTFGYDVPAPDGTYELTFEFAEYDPTTDWQSRVLDVRVEGSTEVDNLDVRDEVGLDAAYTAHGTGTVTDGTLTVEFVPESWNKDPMVSGLVARLVDAVAFQESGGEVVMEAENRHHVIPGTDDDASGDDMSDHSWVEVSDPTAGGGVALEGQPDSVDSAGDTRNGERLDYYVDFGETGTYYVWARMRCSGSSDDSIHVGLDGSPATFGFAGLNKNASTHCHDASGWMWASHAAGSPAEFTVSSAGQHTVNVWMNDDGVEIDRLVVTKDGSYEPSGVGPSESPEA